MSSNAYIQPELSMKEVRAYEEGDYENVEYLSFLDEWIDAHGVG